MKYSERRTCRTASPTQARHQVLSCPPVSESRDTMRNRPHGTSSYRWRDRVYAALARSQEPYPEPLETRMPPAQARQRPLFRRRQACAAFLILRQSYFGGFCTKRKGGTSFWTARPRFKSAIGLSFSLCGKARGNRHSSYRIPETLS